jgi:FRG domain
MSVEEKSFTSTADVVQEVLDICSGLGGVRRLWHRGHPCTEYELRPSLARSVETPEEMFTLERRLLTRFRQRSLPYWPAGYPQDDWEQLFAMQHYGIPTRLLDWTENLFIGMYFAALEPNPNKAGEPHNEDHCFPVLWLIDPTGWNRQVSHFRDFEEMSVLTTDANDLAPYRVANQSELLQRYKPPVALYGTHNSARIVAQRGAFTVAGKSLDSLDSFVDVQAPPSLWKFILEMPRQELRSDLSALGFAESMIFPDLEGVSAEIRRSEGL